MKTSNSIGRTTIILCFAMGALLPSAASGQAAQQGAESGKWQFTATIYGWVPTIDGQVNFPNDKGSTDIHAALCEALAKAGHLRSVDDRTPLTANVVLADVKFDGIGAGVDYSVTRRLVVDQIRQAAGIAGVRVAAQAKLTHRPHHGDSILRLDRDRAGRLAVRHHIGEFGHEQ